jgi:chromosome segregation ATPase
MTTSKELQKLEKQLENAKKRLWKAYKKPYFNLTDEKRIHAQIEAWSNKVEYLENKIELLNN